MVLLFQSLQRTAQLIVLPILEGLLYFGELLVHQSGFCLDLQGLALQSIPRLDELIFRLRRLVYGQRRTVSEWIRLVTTDEV